MGLIQCVESLKRKEWHLRKRPTFPSQLQHRNFTWVSSLQTQDFRQHQLVGFSSLLAYPLDFRLDSSHIRQFLKTSLFFYLRLPPSLPFSVYIYTHTCKPTHIHIYYIHTYMHTYIPTYIYYTYIYIKFWFSFGFSGEDRLTQRMKMLISMV